jgi:glycosyltransferase involved in cell wall biosynthesis
MHVTQTHSLTLVAGAGLSDGNILPSIGEIGVDALPIPRVEIELSATADDLAAVPGWGNASRVMALVRLHTHPVGVVYLDGSLGPSRRRHMADIRATLHREIDAHLLADNQSAECVRRRDAVLADGPFISVVVATRDRPGSLAACLDSLLRNVYPRSEIIVVDNDPSSEATAVMVAERFPSVRYARELRRGLASAHNCGLALVRGEVVAFVDDDVLVDGHWLAAIAEGFAATDQVGCVTGLILPEQLETPAQLLLEHRGGYSKGFDLRVFDRGENRPADPLFPFAAGRLGSGANMAFDVEMLRRRGGFDAALGVGTAARGGDDLFGIFGTLAADRRVVYQPAAIVWHRHYRELTALQNMAHGAGVGTAAYLVSAIIHEPRMLAELVRCVPACLMYFIRMSLAARQDQGHTWPAEFIRIERRGLLAGPAAYAVSRWRARRALAAEVY